MKKIATLFAACAAVAAANAAEPATFDDLELAPESSWYGNLDTEEEMDFASFNSGSWEFNNIYMPEWASWSFFGYSNSTSTLFDNTDYFTQQFNNVVGGGADGSANFGVMFVSAYMGYTEALCEGDPAVVDGMMLTNSAWVEYAILNGDGMSGPFEEGDYMQLIVKGLVDGVPNGSELAIDLADYRSADAADHTYLKEWTWVSLAELGEVNGLRFDITSTKTNSWGITTPTYCCIDNLGAKDPVAVETIAVDSANNAAAEYFTLQGVRVSADALTAGVYIERCGNVARKVVVR